MNGKFIERIYDHSARAILYYKGYEIIFDNYTEYKTSGGITLEMIYARIISPIRIKDGFKFEIHRSNFFNAIAKIFGVRAIVTGDTAFDKALVLKSNNKNQMLAFLDSKELRNCILSFNRINLEISDRKGIWGEKLQDNTYELSCFTKGTIQDMHMLQSLYQLFTIMLDQLGKTGLIQPVVEKSE